MAVSLVALGNQERMLVLEILASRAASPNAVQTARHAQRRCARRRAPREQGPDWLQARGGSRTRISALISRHRPISAIGAARCAAHGLPIHVSANSFETLLVTRMLYPARLAGDTAKRARSIFGELPDPELLSTALCSRSASIEDADRASIPLRRQYFGLSGLARSKNSAADPRCRGEMGQYKALV